MNTVESSPTWTTLIEKVAGLQPLSKQTRNAVFCSYSDKYICETDWSHNPLYMDIYLNITTWFGLVWFGFFCLMAYQPL